MEKQKPAPAGDGDVRPNRVARRAAARFQRRDRGRALRAAHEVLAQAEAALRRTDHLRFRPNCRRRRAVRACMFALYRLRALRGGVAT